MRQVIYPPPINKGDTIGLVAPAGSLISKDNFTEGVQILEKEGFKVKFNHKLLNTRGYLAGSDQERADEFNKLWADPEIKAVVAARGGYGCLRMIDLIDMKQIRKHPKILIGFSDLTVLLNAIHKKTGLVTFHGPVGTSDFNRFSLKSMKKVLMEADGDYKYPYKREKGSRSNTEFDQYTLSGGRAEGVLIGGNISVLDSIIGTRFEPDFENKIVFLEEIGEKTYRVDKMLFHLLSGSNLKQAAGIVMGVFGECNINDAPTLSLKEALNDLLVPLNFPVSYGLSFGHIKRMVTIPTGITAVMDADKNSLMLLEAAVV